MDSTLDGPEVADDHHSEGGVVGRKQPASAAGEVGASTIPFLICFGILALFFNNLCA